MANAGSLIPQSGRAGRNISEGERAGVAYDSHNPLSALYCLAKRQTSFRQHGSERLFLSISSYDDNSNEQRGCLKLCIEFRN